MRVSDLLSGFAREESAQATTEYILILSMLVAIAILLARALVRPVLSRFVDSLSKAIEERMFKPETMHQSPFRP